MRWLAIVGIFAWGSLLGAGAGCGRPNRDDDGDGDGDVDADADSDADSDADVDGDAGGDPDAGPTDAGEPPPFVLTSTAFAEGETIPLRYECGPPLIADGPGENITPPIEWTSGPAATMSYAVVVRDLDAGGLVHWVLYDIPESVHWVPEGVPEGYEVESIPGAKQAELQGSGWFGYLGMCSDGRVNTYQWTVYALETATLGGVGQGTSENDIAAAITDAAIASATLSGES